MNIQDLGSIGELIAAAATIATLIYLARQVRANTKATQTASRVEITRDYRDMNNALYDSDVSLAWETGLREYPNMSFKERSYFGNHFANQALCFQGVFAHFENGQLEDETYAAYLAYFSALVSTPGGTRWWEEIGRPIFVAKMVAAVDARVARGGLGNPLEWPMNVPDGIDAH
jgi:hypothetical protein